MITYSKAVLQYPDCKQTLMKKCSSNNQKRQSSQGRKQPTSCEPNMVIDSRVQENWSVWWCQSQSKLLVLLNIKKRFKPAKKKKKEIKTLLCLPVVECFVWHSPASLFWKSLRQLSGTDNILMNVIYERMSAIYECMNVWMSSMNVWTYECHLWMYERMNVIYKCMNVIYECMNLWMSSMNVWTYKCHLSKMCQFDSHKHNR